jgi:hypothetical protein
MIIGRQFCTREKLQIHIIYLDSQFIDDPTSHPPIEFVC